MSLVRFEDLLSLRLVELEKSFIELLRRREEKRIDVVDISKSICLSYE